ncbi:hypothetical protein TEA_020985 [Camellia sinensis var. sinensis]|uniref:Uncharacterized protein n=1 Tax=Camellia sinensis var. sinensis TaxID=542762 RepID=A0A4S4EB78_CAMSN|nr:hypothetical protein TEA_020985 [Camellia sinensis var. sinensis]
MLMPLVLCICCFGFVLCNSIGFLRDRAQVEQLLRYIVEEPPEDAESKRTFKFPFISCEIFTCEIDVILKTLVEEVELMNLLFSFLEPNRTHSALLAGYFSKVVICLMMRKTVPLMNYVQAHQDVFHQLVDLIGITSIMEVLIRLVGADDHFYPNSLDVMQWLANSDLLEMIVDKLSPSSSPEVHANAAETLCAITRNASSALAAKLSSPSFVGRIFGHALEDSNSKSALVYSFSVCISLLDPKRSIPSSLFYSIRSQQMYESLSPANPDTVGAMLPKLGDLLMLLNVSSDEKILPTTYGELRPPLGKHRLKIVEFIAVLMKTGNEVAEKELVSSGTIQRILDLFFEYPFNNSLHHHVESIILSCLESKNSTIVDHLLQECSLIGKILQSDKHPILLSDLNQPTLPAAGKWTPRAGNLGHITRISNKLVQLGNSDKFIQAFLQNRIVKEMVCYNTLTLLCMHDLSVYQDHDHRSSNVVVPTISCLKWFSCILNLTLENSEWNDWQTTVLQERNIVENVYRWACGRPTALQDRTRDSDEDDLHDRDFDVAALANNLSQAFRYSMYDNEDAEEGNGALDRVDEDVYFDDESAEVVISSLRLGDDQGSLFTNSNWFAFQDNRIGDATLRTSPTNDTMDEINLNGTSSNGNSSSDDEVVVGEDELLPAENKSSANVGTLSSTSNVLNGFAGNNSINREDLVLDNDKASASGDMGFFRFETPENEDLFEDRPIPEWVGWGDSLDFHVRGSSVNPFEDPADSSVETEALHVSSPSSGEIIPNGTAIAMDLDDRPVGSDTSQRAATVPSLFEEDVEFVGVELEGTEKAMEQALKEGIVGEAGPMKRNVIPKKPEKVNVDESGSGVKEFNDTNYWRVDQEVAVLE